MDRLLHHRHVGNVRGHSCLMRQHHQLLRALGIRTSEETETLYAEVSQGSPGGSDAQRRAAPAPRGHLDPATSGRAQPTLNRTRPMLPATILPEGGAAPHSFLTYSAEVSSPVSSGPAA